MNDLTRLTAIIVLGIVAGCTVVAGAIVEANGHQVPAGLIGIATGCIGAIAGLTSPAPVNPAK